MTQSDRTVENEVGDTTRDKFGVHITDIKMRGVAYPVYVNQHGAFRTTVEGHELNSNTLRELQTLADRVPRRKVAVEFWTVHPGQPSGRTHPAREGSVSHGYATGFHATSTSSLLLDYDGQRRGTMSGGKLDNAVLIRDDTEYLEIGVLLQAKDRADAALYEWIAAHTMDVHQAVRDALNEAGTEDE